MEKALIDSNPSDKVLIKVSQDYVADLEAVAAQAAYIVELRESKCRVAELVWKELAFRLKKVRK